MRTITFSSILDGVARLYGETALTTDDAAIVAAALDDLRITELFTHAAWRELDVIEQRFYAPDYDATKAYAIGDVVYYSATDAYYTATKASVQPDAMVVEGAGTTEANGISLRDGELNGKPRYTLVGGTTDQDIIYADSGEWFLGSSGLDIYVGEEDVSSPDLVVSWRAIFSGTLPAPTVRRATWADIDAAGIDRATVPTIAGGGNLPTDTYFWAINTELPKIVDFVQAGKTPIGTVNAVTLHDPRLQPASANVPFVRREGALQVVGVSQTSVWVRFTRREPRFTTTAYAGGTTYGIGDLVYDATTGLCYESLTASNTGNAVTDTTHWQPQEIPHFGQRFLTRAALADLYDSKDQEAKAARHEAKAQIALDDAYYVQTRREGQFTRMGVLAGASHQDEPSITSST